MTQQKRWRTRSQTGAGEAGASSQPDQGDGAFEQETSSPCQMVVCRIYGEDPKVSTSHRSPTHGAVEVRGRHAQLQWL